MSDPTTIFMVATAEQALRQRDAERQRVIFDSGYQQAQQKRVPFLSRFGKLNTTLRLRTGGDGVQMEMAQECA